VQATLLDVLVHGELTGEKPAASADNAFGSRRRTLAALRVLGTRTRATHEPRLRNPTKRKGGDAMNAARTRGSREDDETHID
jgi:hypothetical protein